MQSPRHFPLLPQHHRPRPHPPGRHWQHAEATTFPQCSTVPQMPIPRRPTCKNTASRQSHEDSQTTRRRLSPTNDQPAAARQTLTIRKTLPTTSKMNLPHRRCRFATPIPEPCFSSTPECCHALNSAINSGKKATRAQTSRLRHFVKTPNAAPYGTDTRPQCA